jgi:hypothetical protein
VLLVLSRTMGKRHLLPNHPFRLVAGLLIAMRSEPLADRNPWQADILHHRPDDRQAAGFGRKGVNLIGALPHIAKQAFNGVGTSDVAVHDRRKRIKRQQMLFIFAQAAYGFWIALLVFGECSPPN